MRRAFRSWGPLLVFVISGYYLLGPVKLRNPRAFENVLIVSAADGVRLKTVFDGLKPTPEGMRLLEYPIVAGTSACTGPAGTAGGLLRTFRELFADTPVYATDCESHYGHRHDADPCGTCGPHKICDPGDPQVEPYCNGCLTAWQNPPCADCRNDSVCPVSGCCTVDSNCDPYQYCEGGTCTDCPGDPLDCPASGLVDCCSHGQWKCCQPGSPVVLDVDGAGFSFTSAEGGVWFDLAGTGVKKKFSWTAADSSNAWLALDRNGNGVVDNGKELFGNFTSQPSSDKPNGFMALAEFDKAQHGGNDDGVIDARDAVFGQLRLWIDSNHNGVSEPDELYTLAQKDIAAISLEYRESRRRDAFGNEFRYRAKLDDEGHVRAGRWAYDVFLLEAR